MNGTTSDVVREAVPHRASTTAWTLGLPLAAVGVTVAVALSWRDELPDPLASHWGPDGVDGYSAFWPFVGGLGAVALGVGLGMWVLGTRLGRESIARRVAVGTAVFVALFVCALLLSLLAAQRGLSDPSAVRSGGLTEAVISVGSAAVALIAARLVPGDRRRPTAAPVPAEAARLPLGSQENAAWLAEAGRSTTVPVVLGALALGVVVGGSTGMWLLAVVLAAVLGAVLVVVLHWTVTVDGTGLTARTLLRRPSVHVPLDEVEHAEVVQVHPLRDFGGYGLRIGLDGRTGVVLRGGEAIEVHRTGGRVVLVTVDDAATGAALLNTLAARHRPTPPPSPR